MAQYDLTPVLAKHLDRHLVRRRQGWVAQTGLGGTCSMPRPLSRCSAYVAAASCCCWPLLLPAWWPLLWAMLGTHMCGIICQLPTA